MDRAETVTLFNDMCILAPEGQFTYGEFSMMDVAAQCALRATDA